MNNFEAQQKWLAAPVSKEEAEEDFKKLKSYLISIGQLISCAVGINPLEFANLLEKKLNRIKEHLSAPSNQELEKYSKRLAEFKESLKKHIDKAICIANEMESYCVKSTTKKNIDLILRKELENLQQSLTKTNSIERSFDKALSSYATIIESISNELETETEQSASCPVNNISIKYPDNQLAKLFLKDEDFLNYLLGYHAYYSGEIGHLFLQRTFFILNNKIKHKELAKKAIDIFFRSHSNVFFAYDAQTFKLEVIKLALYREFYNDPVAWIGSSATLMHLLRNPNNKDETEIPGIYLNCDDNKWTSELNRAWLLALFHMGYEVKLVEQQFPNVQEALRTKNPTLNFLMSLTKEFRPLESSKTVSENIRTNDSQYNGNDSPTATSLEILFLLSIGYIPCLNYAEGNTVLKRASSIRTPEKNNSTCNMMETVYPHSDSRILNNRNQSRVTSNTINVHSSTGARRVGCLFP